MMEGRGMVEAWGLSLVTCCLTSLLQPPQPWHRQGHAAKLSADCYKKSALQMFHFSVSISGVASLGSLSWAAWPSLLALEKPLRKGRTIIAGKLLFSVSAALTSALQVARARGPNTSSVSGFVSKLIWNLPKKLFPLIDLSTYNPKTGESGASPVCIP